MQTTLPGLLHSKSLYATRLASWFQGKHTLILQCIHVDRYEKQYDTMLWLVEQLMDGGLPGQQEVSQGLAR